MSFPKSYGMALGWPLGAGTGASAVDPDAAAVIAAMTVTPSPLRQGLINQMVGKLKSGAVWPKLDTFYIFDAHDKQAALLNWKVPSTYTLTEVGTTTGRFTADKGFTGNGSDYALASGFAPSTAGGKFTANDAMYFSYVRGPNSAMTAPEIGVNGSTRLIARSTGDVTSTRTMSSSTLSPPADVDQVGFYLSQRTGAAEQTFSKDAGTRIMDTSASTGLSSSPFRLFNVTGVTGYSTRNLAADGWGASLTVAEEAAANDAVVWWQKSVGSFSHRYWIIYGDPIFSTDQATYNTFSQACIPAIEAFPNGLLVSAEYGLRNAPPGSSPDGATDAYMRLSSSTDQGATWSAGYFVLPSAPGDSRVLDAQIQRLPDGRLLVLYATRRSGINGTITVGFIVQNPTASPSTWQRGPFFFVGHGIPGRPMFRSDGTMRIPLCNQAIGETQPYTPYERGNHYCSLEIVGDIARIQRISTVPDVAPTATMNDYYESSPVQLRDGRTLETFRTQSGQYITFNPGDGLPGQWSAPVPMPNLTTTNSRTHLIRSPSGRLIWAFNNCAAPFRINMSLAIWENDDVTTAPYLFTFDTRAGKTSYPSIAFELDANGNYTGWIIVAYDRGRGEYFDGTSYISEINYQRINEAAVVAGTAAATTTRKTRTS
jgi:hypothetical protein